MNDPAILLEWIKPLKRWNKNTIQIVEQDDKVPSADSIKMVQIRIYTAEHVYSISAHERPAQEHGYLGCIGWCRTARPGEDHTRGNDLPDGPLTIGTFNAIIADIVAYELKELAPKFTMQNAGITSGDPVSGPTNQA